jgi:peptidyl-prolyl cis-trans isomerase SurA
MLRTLLLSFLLLLSPWALAALETLDSIVAIVNNDVITANELDFRMGVVKDQMKGSKVPVPSDELMRPQVLERIVEQMLALQVAERYGISIDDETLNQAVTTVARNNHTTVSGLREMLEKDGVDYQSFLEDLRKQVTVQRAEQSFVSSKVHLNQEEVNHLFNQVQKSNNQHKQYRLGHILISLPKDPTSEQIAAAQTKAQEAEASLEASSADFFDVALKYSDSKDVLNQADLGLRKRTELPSIFGDSVDTMKPGDVRGPIRSSSGLHLIKLLEVKDDKPMPLDDNQLRARIQEQLYQRKFHEALQNWYTQLRDEAVVQLVSGES